MAGSSAEDIIAMSEGLDITGRGGRHGSQGSRSRGRGRGGRGGNSARGGGAKGEMNREVAVSKALSKLLRHAAEDAGLVLDGEGFARVDKVMKWPRLQSLKITFSDIKTAVTDNAKQRFSMKPNPALKSPPDPDSEEPSDWMIRANQGHSITIESAALLLPVTIEAGNVPDLAIHGTYYAFYQPIIETGGLKKMTRNHIHFSTGLPEDKKIVISGMRSDAEILIYVDIKRSLEDGVLWWISENGVILTEGDENGVLGTKYFQRVEGRRDDFGVLWLDGEEMGELPPAFRDRKPPMGKAYKAHRGNGPAEGRARGTGRGRGKSSKDAEGLAGMMDKN